MSVTYFLPTPKTPPQL